MPQEPTPLDRPKESLTEPLLSIWNPIPLQTISPDRSKEPLAEPMPVQWICQPRIDHPPRARLSVVRPHQQL